MKDLSLKFGITRVFTDFFSLISAWVLGYYLRLEGDFIPFLQAEASPFFPQMERIFPFFICSSLAFLVISAFSGLYKIHSEDSRLKEIFKIFYNIFLWGLLIIAFYALWEHELFFSRIYLFQVLVLSLVFIFFTRTSLRYLERFLLRKGKGITKILTIGKGNLLEKIKVRLDSSPQFRIVKEIKSFEENFELNGIDEIWLLDPNQNKKKIIDFCQINQIGFKFRPDTEGVLLSQLQNIVISGVPLLSVIPTSLIGWGRIQKRFFDFSFSFLVLTLFSPFFVLIAILIKLDSKGPIFYASERVGKNGELFRMYKFRSMVVDAEKLKEKLVEKNQRKGPLFKIKNDPRITKFGGFLRRFSIDELPQLWNVLKGKMSLVGPRAHLPKEVENYTPLQKRVLTIKPGITGLAQINGRSDLEFEEEVKLDLQYITHWNLILDLQIVIQTPLVLIKGEGAD